ncbi:hypothetical protein [Marinifilum sp. D737]|uniref:hypothetical protein n=1 Tax=Marinifilum sp. D737 TaxID=2969628 RepID=UPI0022757CF8|nr:hypothetical protein [Marinifilum sp. D737]MCY1632910.1 hypothetical protein [Marinifilum sp. D737]
MKKGLFLLLLVFAFGCNHDEIVEEKYLSGEHKALTIEKGRLKFASKEALQDKLKEINEKSIEEIYKDFEILYRKDFLSLRPIANPDDIDKLNTLLQSYKERPILKNVIHSTNTLKSSDPENLFEETNNIVSDDDFAGLLNENGEIQIGDTLFKYTESGLYFVHINDTAHLNTYLSEKKDQLLLDNKTKRAAAMEREVSIDDRITRFRIPSSEHNSGNGRTPSKPDLTNLTNEMQKIVSKWEATKGRQTTIAGWFGKRRVAYARVSSHRRAKLIYTNQDFKLWAKTGVEVKYQKKGSGIWWRYEADEIILGINEFSYYVEHKTDYVEKIPKTTWYWENRVFNEHLQDITHGVDKYPDIPILSKIKVVVNLKKLNLRKYGITAPDKVTLSPNMLKKLGWDLLNAEFIKILKGLGRNPKEAEQLSMTAISGNKIYFMNFNYTERRTNSRRLKKIYARKYQTPIIVYDPNKKTNFRIKPDFTDLTTNKTITVDFYGGVKRGDKWYGKRLYY